jgi:3'-phosphoadenosine 5'-phosphosulfate sulfotransferase
MNLTLAVDERIVARARKRAQALGKSLNQLIREYLERLGGSDDAERDVEELRQLSRQSKGRSRGWRFDRDQLHERP